MVQRGDWVTVIDAGGEKLTRRALSGVMTGQDFEVVWACRPEEWDAAQAEEREPIATPWPAEDVTVVESEPAHS